MTTEYSTTANGEIVRNPAPHRGINAKARKVLIESSDSAAKIACLMRRSSDEEVRKKLSSMSLNHRRTDSESSNESVKSRNTSLNNSKDRVSEFDGLEELPPKTKKTHKTLGAIGKTQSAGDLFRKKTQVRTFQQLNIMRLPSVDSVGSDKASSLKRTDTIASIGFLDEECDSDRQSQYEMK
uniref:Uncharacterized protein n=1 Tax=Acrobeloides nanus TaxID=290746 RepID=A0A914C4A9_9BILA